MPGQATRLSGTKTGLLFLLFLLFPHGHDGCSAQAIDKDNIDFTTISVWQDMRSCLRTVFARCDEGACGANAARDVGCSTNTCLCRASTLGLALGDVQDLALERCQNLDDRSSASSILTQYCADKGFTDVVAPTVLLDTPTGAYTVTVALATVTEYVSGGGGGSGGSAAAVGVAGYFVTVINVGWRLWPLQL